MRPKMLQQKFKSVGGAQICKWTLHGRVPDRPESLAWKGPVRRTNLPTAANFLSKHCDNTSFQPSTYSPNHTHRGMLRYTLEMPFG